MAAATSSASPEPFMRTTRKRKVSYKDSFTDDEDMVDHSVKKKRVSKVSRKSKRSTDTDDEDRPFRNDDSDNGPDQNTSKPATRRKSTSKPKEASKPRPKSRPGSDDNSDDSLVPQPDLALKQKLKPKPRPRKPKPTLEDGENGEGVVAKKPRRNKHDPPAIPLLPTEDGADRQSVDPTQVTMADLCEDPGVGRISSRYDAVLESYTATKQRRKEHRVAMLERALAKQRGEALDGEQQESQSILAAQMRRKAQAEDGEEDELFDYDESVQAGTHQVAQIRLDADGNMVLDEETLQVDRAADPNLGDDADMIHIEENDVNKFVNAGTHTKKVAGARWSKDETEFFYDALAQFGTDFQSIALSLGTRPRSQIKAKFNREDRVNPGRITDALMNRKKIDLKALEQKTGRSFDGPIPDYGPSAEVIEAHKEAMTGRATSERVASRRPSEAPSVTSATNGPVKGRRGKRNSMPDDLEIVGGIEDFNPDDD